MDVMPTDGSILGFTNRWFVLGYRTAHEETWGGHTVRIIAPAVFLATKLEAYGIEAETIPWLPMTWRIFSMSLPVGKTS